MTTTPTASPELPDLDRLEALARAATPGPWQQGRLLFTTKTARWQEEVRQQADREERQRVFANFSAVDEGRGRQSISNCRTEENALFIAAANPAAVLALIAAARRAQPEGESLNGRIVSVDVSTDDADAGHRIFAELTGETGSDGTTLLAIEQSRNFAQPEGEAPQAEAVYEVYHSDDGDWYSVPKAQWDRANPNCRRIASAAQHAESGAPDAEAAFSAFRDREGYPSDGPMDGALRAAFREGAALAAQSQDAQAADTELPPLPDGTPIMDIAEENGSGSMAYSMSQMRQYAIDYGAIVGRAALAAKAEAPAGDVELIRVPAHDADSYCRILSILGMEEEGDPVAEVQRLFDANERAQQAAAPGALECDARGLVNPSGEQLYVMVTKRFKSGSFPWSMATESGKAAWSAAAAELCFAPDTIMARYSDTAPSAPGTPVAPDRLMQALTTGIPLQEPVYIAKALRAQREVRVSLAGGTGPGAAAFLVNIQLTPWTYTKEKAEAYAEGFNRATKDYRAALLDVATKLNGSQ